MATWSASSLLMREVEPASFSSEPNSMSTKNEAEIFDYKRRRYLVEIAYLPLSGITNLCPTHGHLPALTARPVPQPRKRSGLKPTNAYEKSKF